MALDQSNNRIWPQLQPELAERIASYLTCNDRACCLRLVNKAAAAQFRALDHTTIHLSQPVPPDAFRRRWGDPNSTRGMTLRTRRHLLCLVSASGSVPNLEVAIIIAGCLPTHDVFQAAAAAGHLQVCQWLRERGCPDVGGLAAAARAGRLEVCQWLLAHDAGRGDDKDHINDWATPSDDDQRLLAAAVAGGHRGVVNLLLNCDKLHFEDVAETIYTSAPLSGSLDILEWAMSARPDLFPEPVRISFAEQLTDVFMRAAGTGDLASLQRLHREQLECRPHGVDGDGGEGQSQLSEGQKTLVLAAAVGSPKTDWSAKVDWLLRHGYRATMTVYNWVPQGWHLESSADAAERLAWLCQQRGFPRPSAKAADSIAQAAARAGHVATLQYLRSQGMELKGRDTAQAAARGGHLNVLSWLVETCGENVPMTASLMDAAALGGHLEVMTWLRDRGCPLSSGTLDIFSSAMSAGNVAVLEWLMAQGCPYEVCDKAFLDAQKAGDLSTIRFLRS